MAERKPSIALVLVKETLSCAVQLAVQWLEEQQLVAVHCSNVELREKIAQFLGLLEEGDQLLAFLPSHGKCSAACSEGVVEVTPEVKVIPEMEVTKEEVEVPQEVSLTEVTPEVCTSEVTAEVGVGEDAADVGVGEVAAEVGVGEVTPEVGVGEVTPEVCISEVTPEVCLSEVTPEVCISEVTLEVGVGEVAAEVGVSEVTAEVGVGEVAAEVGVGEVAAEVGVNEEEEEVASAETIEDEDHSRKAAITEEMEANGEVKVTEEVDIPQEVDVTREVEEQPNPQKVLSMSFEEEDPVDESFSWHNSVVMPPLSDSALEAISSFEDPPLSQSNLEQKATSPYSTSEESGMKYGSDDRSVDNISELCGQGGVEELLQQSDPERSAKQSNSGTFPEEDTARGSTEVDCPVTFPEGVQYLDLEEVQPCSLSVPPLPTAVHVTHSDSSEDEDDAFDHFLTDMRNAIEVMSSCTKPVKAERLQDFVVPDDADLSVLELSSRSSTPGALLLSDTDCSVDREQRSGGHSRQHSWPQVMNLDSPSSPPSHAPDHLILMSPSLRDDEQHQCIRDSVKRLKKEQPSRRRSSIYAYILSDDCGELLEKEWEGDGEIEGNLMDEQEVLVVSPDLTSTPLHQATLNAQNITPAANVTQHSQTHGKENVPACQSTPMELTMPRSLQKKDALARELFCEFNSRVFGNQLPADMTIVWNKRLVKTAGFCTYVRAMSGRSASINLSVKVCSTVERTRETLLHEMCHAAVWLVDEQREAHGPLWKAWVAKAERVYPGMRLNRCHTFDIEAKFLYKCIRCDYSIKRHSKSIDVNSAVCPCCESSLALYNSDGTLYTPRKPSRFAAFVKENFASVRKAYPGTPHQEVMKILSANFSTPRNT